MPVIVDATGRLEITDAELDALRAEDDRSFDAFWRGLRFRTVAEYDRAAGGAVILLGAGGKWAVGYWGGPTTSACDNGDEFEGQPTDRTPTWRNLQDSVEGLPIGFEPFEFVDISAEDVARLSED